MKITSATGATGHILNMFDGTYCFRVYTDSGDFIDYDLHHCDLSVAITDTDAAFYQDETGARLDHNPATLGIKND